MIEFCKSCPFLRKLSPQALVSWIGACLYFFGLTMSLLTQNQSHKELTKEFTFHINFHLLTTFIGPLFWARLYVSPDKIYIILLCGTNLFIHSIIPQQQTKHPGHYPRYWIQRLNFLSSRETIVFRRRQTSKQAFSKQQDKTLQEKEAQNSAKANSSSTQARCRRIRSCQGLLS